MITIHQRNQNVSNDNDTFSKSAQNSLPWVLPDKYITDWLTIPLILSLLALFSLFPPSMNKSLFEKSNVLFSLMTNNSSMNRRLNCTCRIPISNSTYVQISYAKYIPLLCQIWPDFIQKFPCFTNKVLEWYKHMFQIHNFPWWQDQSYSSANYIHCSTKLSVTVHNSIINNSLSKLFFLCPCKLSSWVSDAFVEGHHLSKIRLGTNVTTWKWWYLSVICCCSWGCSNLQVNKNPMTCLPSHTFIYSKY